MAQFKYTSHSAEVLSALKSGIAAGMEMVGGAAEQHGKDAAPVRTGALRDSIKHSPAGDQAQEISANTPYAGFVELGTRKMRAQPYMRPIMNFGSEYVNILRSVLGI